MLRLDKKTLPYLQNKNLLAFSAGVDSTALFFLLVDKNIAFDIALVNYQTRYSSDQEEKYAYFLAQEYKKKIFTIQAPKIEQNFEKKARDFRYDFFEKIIVREGYDNLIMAHQLNDQLEWLLMRLAKGAGLMEMLGLENISQRKEYTIIRPLLHHSKEELLAFLELYNHHYFIDQSNFDTKHERNFFRKSYANDFINHYKEGVVKSFEYLKEDSQRLDVMFDEHYSYKAFRVIGYRHPSIIPKAVDMTLKSLGYLMSHAQRVSIKAHHSTVIGGQWAVEIDIGCIYIAPYVEIPMPKLYKELCRVHKIPSKVRPYFFQESLLPYQKFR